VTVMFRGREISHADLGWKLLQKVIQTLEGVAVLERPALMEGRRMFIILAPGVAQKSKPKEAQDAKVKDA
jgi:translation initiation factor IF-3